VDRVLYFEHYSDVRNAIAREKQLKGWRGVRKVALIESINPSWKDLSREGYRGPSTPLSLSSAEAQSRSG